MDAYQKAGFKKTDKAYEFLIAKEKKGENFSIQELASYVGWKEKSVKTYLSKRWRIYVSKTQKKGKFFVRGLTQLSKQEFRQIHSHAIDCANTSAETSKLIDKSREFALMAVSNYNNPQFKYKTHSFIVNMVIAYTALFHAIFEKNKTEYFYKDKSGNFKLIDGEKKAFELKECCHVYHQGKQTALKSNLEFLRGLRNKIG